MANVRNRSRTVTIELCLSFNFAVVFIFNVFPFPPSKVKLTTNLFSWLAPVQLFDESSFSAAVNLWELGTE